MFETKISTEKKLLDKNLLSSFSHNCRCPIVEEDEAAVRLFQPDQRGDSNNGGCMVANIPSKEVRLFALL